MEYWVWLQQINGIGSVLAKRLLNRFRSPQSIYAAGEEELLSVKGIGPLLAKVILQQRSLDKARALLDKALNQDIKLLCYTDPLYPAIAKESPQAPILLYYKGTFRQDKGVAIVGSRRCTDYGKQAATEAAQYLARHSVPVLSGLAKGIDSYAHTACLKACGYTIAFLGNGVDICYPQEHDRLIAAIIENGLLISAYPPGTRPRPEYFPERNRLISSWSHKVFVVEAGEKGGALITADFAQDQGKEVHVLPHERSAPSGKGCNLLIAKGANIYLNPKQLLPGSYAGPAQIPVHNSLPLTRAKSPSKPAEVLDDVEQRILLCLAPAPKTLEIISAESRIDQIRLAELLSLMEIKGLVQTYAGGKWRALKHAE